MANLRQKTYGIFIRPYIEYGGDRLIQRGGAMVKHPCRGNATCQPYATLLGGEPYMLNFVSTSFVEIRIKLKELMDEIGLSMDDIIVSEIIPTNHIVTPFA